MDLGVLGFVGLAAVVVVMLGVFALVFSKLRLPKMDTSDPFGYKWREKAARYLETALVSRPLLPPGTPVEAPFVSVPGKDHAVWLDFGIASDVAKLDFDISIAVQIGNRTLLDRTCAAHCEIESDGTYVYGLPEQLEPGAEMAAGTIMSESGPGNRIVRTVLRAFRFQAPSTPTEAIVRARVVPKPDVVIEHMTISVTPWSWPGRDEDRTK